jgi:sugar lactone lactonase YvrE
LIPGLRATALVCGVVALFGVVAAGAAAAPRGSVRVLAPVGPPGFPALPHVVGDRVFEGTYDNPAGDSDPSKVFEYSSAGALLGTWTVQGQDLSKPHGVQVAANDTRGRLLLLEKTSGEIIRLDPRTGAQTLYSRVPDLPLCSAGTAGKPCSPAVIDQAPMPDYAAWGPDGSLYVTDYQQAVIWRVPPGGGTPRIWLADRRLDGGPFGTACIALMPDRRTLLFDQASNGGLGGGNPTTGKLYEVALDSAGEHGPLRQLWQSGPADAPDGCALSATGNIYVALVGASNQIVELDPAGHEIARFGQAITGDNGSSVPFDSPSGVAFLGTELVIANQSYFAANPANQALLALETGEQGAPVFVPANAGLPAGRRHCKHHRRHHRRHHRHRHHKHHRHHHHRSKPRC